MDAWDEGTQYDDYMGRWSRSVAQGFLAWLDVPPGARWVDVGCGTGALTGAILHEAEPRGISALDPSPGFIATAQRRLGDGPDFRVGSAEALPFGTGEFDVAVSGLALNFFPEPAVAVRELRRVTRQGGLVAAYVWDYADGMQMIRMFWDAALALDPASANLDEAVRFPLCRPDRLDELFEEVGLIGTEVTGLRIPTVFETFEDYWNPMLGGQGPAPTYAMSLAPAQRDRLRKQLEQALPHVDGRLDLTAKAWAVKGTV